jgi:hypothetical protein
MGKRSNFERKPRDFYPTPLEAVVPLVPHLPDQFTYVEPCAGDGKLIENLDLLTKGVCIIASDIEPQKDYIKTIDALELIVPAGIDFIITNPPWACNKQSGFLLHKLIENFSNQCPTWLLFYSDWIHTKQSSELVKTRLRKIVSIGRVKWIEDSAGTGKDNCCWYLFDSYKNSATEFYGR